MYRPPSTGRMYTWCGPCMLSPCKHPSVIGPAQAALPPASKYQPSCRKRGRSSGASRPTSTLAKNVVNAQQCGSWCATSAGSSEDKRCNVRCEPHDVVLVEAERALSLFLSAEQHPERLWVERPLVVLRPAAEGIVLVRQRALRLSLLACMLHKASRRCPHVDTMHERVTINPGINTERASSSNCANSTQ